MIFVAQAAAAVRAALEAGAAGGRVAVLGQPRLGKALAATGHEVLSLSGALRSLRRTGGERVCAAEDRLPLADGALGAVVGAGAAQAVDWEALLGEWRRVVGPGGIVVMLDRVAAEEASRRALCAGLSDLEQRTAGRTVITSGTVRPC